MIVNGPIAKYKETGVYHWLRGNAHEHASRHKHAGGGDTCLNFPPELSVLEQNYKYLSRGYIPMKHFSTTLIYGISLTTKNNVPV